LLVERVERLMTIPAVGPILQTVLIEAAKMAPRNSPELAMVYEQEKQKGNANRATLAVARKMVAYLVAVDRRQKGFLVVENKNRTAA